MALLLKTLRMHALLAIGGAPSTAAEDASVTATDLAESANERVASIINDAGRHLFARPWGFRARSAVDVDFIADQEYAEIPADVGELTSIRESTVNGSKLRIVTSDELNALRVSATQLESAWPFVAALARPAVDPGEAFPDRRLELYPTPTASGTLVLWYQARWLDVTAAMDGETWYVHVPWYAEPVLKALVRAIALGDEDGNTEARIAAIEAGPQYRNAWTADCEEHPVGSELRKDDPPFDPFSGFTLELPS